MVLYINCCPREESRTDRLARALLAKLGEYEELDLYSADIKPLDRERLDRRTELIARGDYTDPMFGFAKQFAAADTIVIAAPFWDYSFPSMLKTYLENIYVTGLTSKYDESGMPCGLCRADRLCYVTTAGGPYDGRFSFDYVQALATVCFGIRSVELYKAEMLDIYGADPDAILQKAMEAYGLTE